jgi:MFS transporter, OPA family, glycerol-3-phosphate transporter
MISRLLSIYKPAPFDKPIPPERVPHEYTKYRLQMILTIFIGYAGYYIVRNNFAMAKPYLIGELGYTKGDVGLMASALTIAYGISKFVMGNLSDRSNPRYFLATGLICSAVVNLFFGFLPSFGTMMLFWFVNGWFQGMGWPPCGRTMVHWFSDKERGTKMALWNLAHNVGGMLAPPLASLAVYLFLTWKLHQCGGSFAVYGASFFAYFSQAWKSIFYFPGLIALVVGVLIIVFLRDTPQSVGLPPIEEFKNDYPDTGVEDRERELSGREILLNFVLNNRFLWILALANVVVYVVRYGVLNWAPTYLTEVKGYTLASSGWQSCIYECAGIPGMLLSGWASDRFFRGRRAPIMVIFMSIVTIAVAVYWLNPKGNFWLDSVSLFAIGFMIYGPVMLIGVAAVDLVPKKAAGTAAGFTGLFGYMGATVAELGIGKIVQYYGWDTGFILIIVCAILSIILLSLTWNVHDRGKNGH